MKLKIGQIPNENEEKVIVCCHDSTDTWVQNVREAALGQISVCGYKNEVLYRLRLSDIYYFEVVDGASFFYTKKDVYTAKEKLYEFASMSAISALFRCSKSMRKSENADYSKRIDRIYDKSTEGKTWRIKIISFFMRTR